MQPAKEPERPNRDQESAKKPAEDSQTEPKQKQDGLKHGEKES
jgi:hypothetical protein